jgi:hypothetical protein
MAQKGVQNGPLFDPFLGHIWALFWAIFGPLKYPKYSLLVGQMGPKMGPKRAHFRAQIWPKKGPILGHIWKGPRPLVAKFRGQIYIIFEGFGVLGPQNGVIWGSQDPQNDHFLGHFLAHFWATFGTPF